MEGRTLQYRIRQDVHQPHKPQRGPRLIIILTSRHFFCPDKERQHRHKQQHKPRDKDFRQQEQRFRSPKQSTVRCQDSTFKDRHYRQEFSKHRFTDKRFRKLVGTDQPKQLSQTGSLRRKRQQFVFIVKPQHSSYEKRLKL
jgi:hypothetical protein